MMMQNGAAAEHGRPTIDDPAPAQRERLAELELLLQRVNAAMAPHVSERLGTLKASAATTGDDGCALQIRSEPIDPAGCEFRYPDPIEPEGDADQAAAEVLAAAVRTMYAVPRLADWTAEVRRIAAGIIGPASEGAWPMRVTAIGVTPYQDGDEFETTIDVAMLGSDLRPQVTRVGDPDLAGLATLLRHFTATHAARVDAFAEATAAGVRGRVDQTALRVAARAGVPIGMALEHLETSRQISLLHGGEDADDVADMLFWDDGVVRAAAENMPGAPVFQLEGQVLGIPRGLPDTVVAALPGRRLREVVDLALIPETSLIVDVREDLGWLRLRLKTGREPIAAPVTR